MKRVTTTIRGRQVAVARQGSGPPLLLIHGGWAGAEMHWSSVWAALTRHHEVVAPDLPGLGDVVAEPLGSVREYAEWLVELLDALAIERVAVVGNSFGATVAWSLAGRFPQRCSALVLVDGFPMPKTPEPLRQLSRLPGTRKIFASLVGRMVYSESKLERAFADLERVPSELRRAMRDDWPIIVPRYIDILVAGDGPPEPLLRPLLLWGISDRLPGSSARDALRWHQKLAGSSLQMVEGAGHFPQVEAPDRFVELLEGFLNEQEADVPADPIRHTNELRWSA
jgi:2-hydroxy-6-oxonona-2,4-dienedioate hydrolase